MAMKNRHAYRSRISEAKIRQFVKLFSVDLTASQIAELSGVNRNAVNRRVTAFRERIARYREAESPVRGKVEVDESRFGARRVRGVRGRGARGKTIVFGLFKRNDKVCAKSFLIAPEPLSRASYVAAWTLKVSFIPMAGEVMTDSSIWDMKNTSASSIRITNFPINTHRSMG